MRSTTGSARRMRPSSGRFSASDPRPPGGHFGRRVAPGSRTRPTMIPTLYRPPTRRRLDPIFGISRRISAEPRLDSAAAMCRAIAPTDLTGFPLYIVPKRLVPDGLGGDAISGGFTGPCLDLVLKDVIGSAWRG